MKPQRIVETVEVVRWSCQNPDHKHRSESAALTCIAKAAIPKRVNREWTPALKRSVFSHVANGGTWAQAGSMAGVTAMRVRAVIHKMMRQMHHPSHLTEPMPDHDYRSVEDFRAHREFWLRRLDALHPPEAAKRVDV